MLFAGHAIAGVRGLRVVMVSLDESFFLNLPLTSPFAKVKRLNCLPLKTVGTIAPPEEKALATRREKSYRVV
jgi:hypothetical protein